MQQIKLAINYDESFDRCIPFEVKTKHYGLKTRDPMVGPYGMKLNFSIIITSCSGSLFHYPNFLFLLFSQMDILISYGYVTTCGVGIIYGCYMMHAR